MELSELRPDFLEKAELCHDHIYNNQKLNKLDESLGDYGNWFVAYI
jgi:hypothetical protein